MSNQSEAVDQAVRDIIAGEGKGKRWLTSSVS